MKTILVAVDLSDASEAVLRRARELAQRDGARVYLLHVADPDPDFVGFDAGPDSVRDQVATELREEHRTVQAHADALRAEGLDATALLVRGATVATILHEADKLGAEVLVVGTHGRGAIARALMGSVSTGLIAKSDVPVLVVPTRPAGEAGADD